MNDNNNECIPNWLSSEWLTTSLHQNDTIDKRVSVTNFDIKVLTGGLMASTLLLTLQYKNANGSEPNTIIGKFPSSDISSRTAGKEMLAYEREVNFYKFLSSKLSMRVPACYFSEIDTDSANFSILLEDLNPAILATPESDHCLEYAKQSIDQLIKLQSDTWSNDEIKIIPWVLDYSDHTYIASTKDWALKGWKILCSTADERLPKRHQELGASLINRLERWSDLINMRACLAHCDYRFANVLYKSNEAITVDWQTIHWCNPGADLAYFMINSLSVEQREMWQEKLRQRYFEGLLSSGIHYTKEEADFDYNMGIIYCILMLMVTAYGIGASGLSDPARDQLLDAIARVTPLAEKLDVLHVLQ